MTKSVQSLLTLTTLGLILASCSQGTPAPANSTVINPTNGSTIAAARPAPVFAGGLHTASASSLPPEVINAFKDATPMSIGAPWNVDGAQELNSASVKSQGVVGSGNGYTITFYDFYGVSFAYLNTVDRANDSTPAALLQAAASEPETDADPSNWNVATYTTGANTSRDVVSGYERGAFVLNSIFGNGVAPGFDRTQVAQYVMPDGENYWAKMNDGRYYDLKARAFVASDQLQKAQDDYAQRVSTFQQSGSSTPNTLKDAWTRAQNVRFTDRPTTGPVNPGATRPTNTLTAQWSSSACGTRTFLWWRWTACDTIASNYVGAIDSWDTARYAQAQPIRASDGYYMGCGPVSMGRLMQWYKDRKGVNTMDNYSTTIDNLVGYMRSYGPLAGGNRATNPWDYINGANAYLSARGVSNRVAGTYGQPDLNWQNQIPYYMDKFGKNEPVVMFHFSSVLQHFGIVTQFNKGNFMDLMVYMPDSPTNKPLWLNQSAYWSAFLTGVYVLN